MLKTLKKWFEGDLTGWRGIIILVLVSAITYLPHVLRLTYFRDDWYYMLDGFTGGSSIFHAMFSIDRPARGFLFDWYFQLFGLNPLPYNLGFYLWRLLSGLGALGLFRLLWPGQKRAGFWMALLFVLYPGYLWWVAGVEYQPMILSVCLQAASIALTLVAVRSHSRMAKLGAMAGAIVTGWVYILLVDYAIGMEALRFLCVYIYITHAHSGLPVLKRVYKTLRAAWVYFAIPAGYLVWNLFFFQNQRPETDIFLQVGSLFSNPVYTASLWAVHLLQSVSNVALFSWFVPFYQSFYSLRLKVMLAGLGTGLLVLLILWLADYFVKTSKPSPPTDKEEAHVLRADTWQIEAFWLGLLGTIFGALPVVLANRSIVFDAYSHYALPPSLAACMLVVGLVYLIKQPLFQKCLLMGLVFLAVLTHYGTASNALDEEQTVQSFWWQVSWRASGLQPGTTLLVNYPGVFYGEDEDIVWGPANLLFAPHRDPSIPITYPITALPQNFETTKMVIAGGGLHWEYRTHSGEFDFDRLLIISQPSSSSCVHVIDSRWPRLSITDSDQAILLAPYSNIETLVATGTPPQPPGMVFGEEPPHEWCYYFQKAEAALANMDWAEVNRLGGEAAANGFRPADPLEWMPFLQAAVYLGDEDQITAYASMINEDSFLHSETCKTIKSLDGSSGAPPAGSLSLAKKLFCGGSN